MTRFRLDGSTRRLDDGRILLGGSPLKMFRLSAAGARLLDRVEAGTPLTGNHRALTDRLLDAGAIHPEVDMAGQVGPDDPEPGHPRPGHSGSGHSGPGESVMAGGRRPLVAADVTLVVPAYRSSAESLADLVRTTGAAISIVVDDASPEPIGTVAGARTIRLAANVGPGGARSAGFAEVTTPVVAFVDTDVVVEPGWLERLLGHFDDDRVGLVAPRVRSIPGSGVLRRYEEWRSPLDLGGAPARIRAGSRVGYVPGAVLLVRSAALTEVGGFDDGLRWGEDVDLVWRLDAAGWRCRYEPAVEVGHAAKPSWRAWLRQRFDYGSSAAPLAAAHPGALAPARVSGWSAASWLLLVGGRRTAPAGAATALATTLALIRKLQPMEHPATEAFRLAGLGHLFAGRILAGAITRAWWPIAVVLAVVSRRCRRVVLAAAIVPPLLDWNSQRPSIDPLRAVAVRCLDDVAYGAGVWAGVVHHRSIAALVPDLSNWPGKKPSEAVGDRPG